MIVRGVEKIVGRCLESVRDYVDEVIVVDTGSEDATKEVVKKTVPSARILDFGPAQSPDSFTLDVAESWDNKIPGPYTGKMMLTDFAAARQWGWKEAKCDYQFWIDSDDTVEDGNNLKTIVTEMSRRGIDMGMLNYDYEHDGAGNVTLKLPRERLARRGLKSWWSQPVHEVLLPGGLATFFEGVNVRHHRGRDKLPVTFHHRNLKILVGWFRKNKHLKDEDIDPRLLFYFGMEGRFNWPEQALSAFERYQKKSGWPEERAIAHHLAGTTYERLGRFDKAFCEYAMAAVEHQENPDGLLGCARMSYHRKDWGKVIDHTERAFKTMKDNPDRRPMIMEDPHDRLWRPHVFLTVALVNTGNYTRCIEVANEGLMHNPTEPHMLGNKIASEKNLEAQKKPEGRGGSADLKFHRNEPLTAPPQDIAFDILLVFALQLWKRALIEDPRKALMILDGLPSDLAADPKAKDARSITNRKISGEEPPTLELAAIEEPRGEPVMAPEKAAEGTTIEVGKRLLKVVIWTGPAWENWSPKTLETGIGGSETAAIHVAAELARRGHSVKVLGNCGGEEGFHDGVEYVNHERAVSRPREYDSDVFISSRQPLILTQGGFHSRTRFVWVHDVHVGSQSEVKEALLKADRVMALSKWHRDFLLKQYPFLTSDMIYLTRNGIDARRFERPSIKSNKLIYASSLERGLKRLIELWPAIRSEVPDAELHVYYGFGVWESMAKSFNNSEQLTQIAYYRDLLEKNPPAGVHYHGRVGQRELADAYLSAKVWAYPTWFAETSCISAMEAQAAGAVPVTTAMAALEETVRHGFLIRAADTTPEYAAVFVKRVISLLRDEKLRSGYAEAGRAWALKELSWSGVVSEWEALFSKTLDEKTLLAGLALPEYGGA